MDLVIVIYTLGVGIRKMPLSKMADTFNFDDVPLPVAVPLNM